jgi:hypothetical protein
MNEQLDNVISHNDYIVEGTSSIIEYTEYLKENTQNLAGYLNHIVKEINEGKVTGLEGAQSIDENLILHSNPTRTIVDKIEGNEEDAFQKTLTDKLNTILESAKTVNESVDANKLHFLNFLSENKRNQFEALTPEKKDEVIAVFESNKFYGSVDAERLYESAFIAFRPITNWLTNMPAKYKDSWNNLNESQRNSIKAQASVKVLDNQYKIDDFWATRDLRSVKVDAPLNEGATPAIINETAEYQTPANYMETVQAELRRRFNR